MHGQISLELAHSVQIILLFSVFLKHLSNCDAFSGKKKKKAILEMIAFAPVTSNLLWTKDRAFCCYVEWFSCSAHSCMNIQLPLWAPVVAREGKVGGIPIMLQLWFFHCPFPFFWKLCRLEGSHYRADHDSMYSLTNVLWTVWMNNKGLPHRWLCD